MDKLRPFYLFLKRFVDLTEDEFTNLIMPDIEVRQFRKRELILKDGEIENYQNYVLTGLVRKFYVHSEEEIITQIAKEGHIIGVQESFYTKSPSEFCLQALEPTTLVSMNYDNLNKCFGYNAKMERLGRLVLTSVMVLKDRWHMNRIRLSPRERFVDFVLKNPDMLQRVPQKYLASYLNIQPETFSRFKHLLKEKRVES
jgi:CRP-like cAMP-binding protein